MELMWALLLLFTLGCAADDVDDADEGEVFRTDCSKLDGKCDSDSGFDYEEVWVEVPGKPTACMCQRPYTKEELKKLHGQNCIDYSKACKQGESNKASCELAKSKCDKAGLAKLCADKRAYIQANCGPVRIH